MKQKEQSMQTRLALSRALKSKMQQKSVSRITVSELIEECGVNRKTFYYHFSDIYALLKWTLEEEAIEVVKSFDLLVNYEDAIRFVIEYVEGNKHILTCALDAFGREELKGFFVRDFLELTRTVIVGTAKNLSLSPPESYVEFLTVLYTEAVAGSLVDWIRSKDIDYRKEQIIEYLSLSIRYSLPAALSAFDKERSL